MASQVSAATAASWCSPSSSCTSASASASAAASPPSTPATASTAYRARLPLMRTACQSSSGPTGRARRRPRRRCRRRRAAATAWPTSRGSTAVGRLRGRLGQPRLASPRPPARRAACGTASDAHRLVQRLQRVLVPGGQFGVDAGHRGLVQRRQRIGRRGAAQPGPQHLGVAGRAERVGQPAQLARAARSAQSRSSSGANVRRSLRSRRQPTRIWCTGGVAVAAPARAAGRAGRASKIRRDVACAARPATTSAARRAACGSRRRRRRPVRRLGGRPPSARTCLGVNSPARRAGVAQRRLDLVEQLAPCRPCAPPRSRGTCSATRRPSSTLTVSSTTSASDPVVAVAAAGTRGAPCAASPPAPAAAPRVYAVRASSSRSGTCRGGAGHGDLVADAGRAGGQLDRPRLVVAAAVPQRRPGAGQPQVGGVVVGGAQRLRRAQR